MNYIIVKKRIGKSIVWQLISEKGILRTCRTKREAMQAFKQISWGIEP